jgi:allophanate hydrolase
LPSLAIAPLQAAYRTGALTPLALVERWLAEVERAGDDNAWITRTRSDALYARADALMAREPASLPLYGIPFAVKDNIDVAGMPTTAACPAFAHTPQTTATVVQRLLDAGAILVGKTNLDQFATGLVGTRSPYGAVANAFDAAYVSGGSSSGSASVVARGFASFALGTDTAGSGRVPAGFNNLVGLKPTRGLLPTTGVLPACRTLDCVSIFAGSCGDAAQVLAVAQGVDAQDAYSRAPTPAPRAQISRLGVPKDPEFFGDTTQAAAFTAALQHARALGLQLVELDFAPLHAAAALLYDGPWVAERYAAISSFLDAREAEVEPSVRSIIGRGRKVTGADVFAGQYALAALCTQCEALLQQVDALLVPTAPTIHRIDAVARDPIALNSQLGHYTNFVNLLDWSALAVPAGFRTDGLPFGCTLIAPTWCEAPLLTLGARWHARLELRLGATSHAVPHSVPTLPAQTVRIAVVGAHLTGMPLNHQLTERHAALVTQTTTAPRYRLHALADTVPAKPGLQRVAANGGSAAGGAGGGPIVVEVWDMPAAGFGSFVAAVPPPLAIGSVELADGSWVKGFVCEPHALLNATDITAYGGWRGYMAAASCAATASVVASAPSATAASTASAAPTA